MPLLREVTGIFPCKMRPRGRNLQASRPRQPWKFKSSASEYHSQMISGPAAASGFLYQSRALQVEQRQTECSSSECQTSSQSLAMFCLCQHFLAKRKLQLLQKEYGGVFFGRYSFLEGV